MSLRTISQSQSQSQSQARRTSSWWGLARAIGWGTDISTGANILKTILIYTNNNCVTRAPLLPKNAGTQISQPKLGVIWPNFPTDMTYHSFSFGMGLLLHHLGWSYDVIVQLLCIQANDVCEIDYALFLQGPRNQRVSRQFPATCQNQKSDPIVWFRSFFCPGKFVVHLNIAPIDNRH